MQWRLALASSALLSFAVGGSAAGQTSELEGQFASAIGPLTDLIDVKNPKPSAPRLSDPAQAPRFQAIGTAMAAFGTPSFPVDGIRTFDSVCAPLNKLNVGYLLFGLGALPRPKSRTPMPTDIQRLGIANTARFKDELSWLAAYNIKCVALHLPFITNFWDGISEAERTPIRRAGINQMLSGLEKVVAGSLTSLGDTRITLTNRRRVASAIDIHYVGMTGALGRARRANVLAQLQQVKPYIPAEFMPIVAKVEAVARGTKCESLCKVE